jgi:hypothetical protein
MQQVHAAGTCSRYMRHGHAAWACSKDVPKDMKHGHTCNMDVQKEQDSRGMLHGYAAGTNSMDMQHEYVPRTCSIDMQHRQAAWPNSMDML